LMLVAMVMASAFAMDVYIPALPTMATIFNVSAKSMQLTLTLFTFTMSFVQLVIGPLTDHYGRRRASFVSIAFFAVGSFLCAQAMSLHVLLFGRVIQAIGVCGMLVIGFAIARDRHHGRELGQVISYLNGIISFSPMVAPTLGGYLIVYFGWPATFYILEIIALAAFISVYFYVTEIPGDKTSLSLQSTFTIYSSILTSRLFRIYAGVSAFGLTYFFIFCSISSYLLIKHLHVAETTYGLYFAFMGVSILIGSFLSAMIITRLGIYRTVLLGNVLSLSGGILMWGWNASLGVTVNGFVWPMLLIGVGGTFSLGAGTAGTLEPFPHNAGSASALGGAIRFFIPGLLSMLLISDEITDASALYVSAIGLSVLAIAVLSVFRKALYDQISHTEKT